MFDLSRFLGSPGNVRHRPRASGRLETSVEFFENLSRERLAAGAIRKGASSNQDLLGLPGRWRDLAFVCRQTLRDQSGRTARRKTFCKRIPNGSK